MATEVAVTGIPWTFAPTLAVVRDDRWGRTYESYSEDPEIVRQYAEQMVKGIQGEVGSEDFLVSGHMLATAKHFVGDGGTLGGNDQGNTVISEEELFNIHAQGYLSALEAGVQTIMVSFSSWNGQKMHGSKKLLTEVLKNKMGFDGLLVGDWSGHGQVPGCTVESCAAAFNAGLDMFMVPEDWKALWENTVEQIKSGEITMARLDDAVRRILRVKMRAGLFKRGAPSTWPLAGKAEFMGSPEHRAVARQAVRESLVLLKNNEQLLPLRPQSRVLVAGSGADNIGMQTGGWTMSWQGTGNKNSDFPGATSIFTGIEQAVHKAGGTAVLSEDGSYTDKPDVAIVVWGENPYAEFQGDIRHIQYRPGHSVDLELLQNLKAKGIPVVSVFLSGRPMWVNAHLNASDAFVAAWLPGSEGNGVADLLFRTADGEIQHDFSGRLSFSWPQRVDQVELNVHSASYDPLFAFGYGLSTSSRVQVANDLSIEGIEVDELPDLNLFVNRVNEPWMIGVGVSQNHDTPGETWEFYDIDDQVQQRPGYPQVNKAQHKVQEDALAIRWDGNQTGAMWLVQDFEDISDFESNDLSEYLLSDGVIQFNIKLKSGELTGLFFEVNCLIGNDVGCKGRVDLSKVMSVERDTGIWRTVNIELECLDRFGMDLTKVGLPFTLVSDQALEVEISDVRIMAGPGNAEPAKCHLPGFLK